MSAEKNKGGGSAAQSVRMDQEYQLQNLHRLAMNHDFESMGQYADVHSGLASRGKKDVASYTSAQGDLSQNTPSKMKSGMAIQALHGEGYMLPQTSIQNMITQQGTRAQVQNSDAIHGASQANDDLSSIPGTLGAMGSDYGTWKMTTSPPRLFMTPRELDGSAYETSDESSLGTRVSSSAFSLTSSGDDRLVATDNPMRVPRAAFVVNDVPVWSDPNPGGFRHIVLNPEVSPTPVNRGGLLNQGASLVSRLNFAPGYGDDVQSNSGDSVISDIQSQVMPIYDSASSASGYQGSSRAVSVADDTIKAVGGRIYPGALRAKPSLRRTPANAIHEVGTSAHYAPAPLGARYPQDLQAPVGFAYMGNNVAYSSANMAAQILNPESSYAGSAASGNEYQSPRPVLGSPIVMRRPSLVPFHQGVGVGNGDPTPTGSLLPARSPWVKPQSPQLSKLLDGLGGTSTAAKMLDTEFFPFIETAREGGGAVNHGVIKITNVPFEIGRNEVYAFLGRNSRVLQDSMEPIHIIMCRVTGKTLDIYVELQTAADAARAVERHLDNCAAGRPSKLGDRQVDVHLSDQTMLMKVMFPKAPAVHWLGNVPAIPEKTVSPYQSFRGFLSDEELTMMTKHVENPARCPFSRGCPERPFECLIGTLKKFPWDKTKHITIRQRYRIFHTTYKLIDILKKKVDRGIYPVRLTANLLKRLIATAMSCPGFTVLQKADIASLVGLESDRAREFGLPPQADRWRHQYATSVKAGIPFDLVEWYIGVIANETKENVDAKFTFHERQEIQRHGAGTDDHWGYFWLEVNLPCTKDLEEMTLHEIAEREFGVIEDILRRAARKMAGDRAIQE
ncbi:uncharacterized protein DNG_06447 [Cephalotrichum gorgonifer]|uniref:Uncharacterized protein n=1 Tax=Cephalotrichum gorgonifer TaxID=2041049 RepID=A0AAE8SWM0_9PEZI|nr:uncharacterized protein DNG_06447 [Cephalotrichum gorgonifer]